MKLEVIRIWEDGTWDTEFVKTSFILDNSSECWEQCKDFADRLSFGTKCITVYPWSIEEREDRK